MREAKIRRKTKEVEVSGSLRLDGEGEAKVDVGIKFFNHLLETMAKHALVDLEVKASGDLRHHLVEDVGLAIGSAISEALGAREGVKRFGHAYVAMDEALARAVVDLSGRPYAKVDLKVGGELVEDMKGEDAAHFFRSLAQASKLTLHLDVIRGENAHHKLEAAAKSFALAFKEAASREERLKGKVPSAKGVL